MSSLADQLTCARREWKLRERVYPRFIERGTMTAAQARYELATMAAIVETLSALAEAETAALQPALFPPSPGPGPLRRSPLDVLAQYPGNAAREEAAALAEKMRTSDHEPEPKGALL